MNRKTILILCLVFLLVFAPNAAYAAPFHHTYNTYKVDANGTVITPGHHNFAVKNPYYHNLARITAYNAYLGSQRVYTLNGYTFTRYRDYINYYNYLYSHPELYDCEVCPTCPGCAEGELIPQGAVPLNSINYGRLRYIYR